MYIGVSGIVVSNAGAGGVPVGIAVARQRLQHQETSTSMRNVSLSHHTSHHASYHHFQPDNLGKFLQLLYVSHLDNVIGVLREDLPLLVLRFRLLCDSNWISTISGFEVKHS